MRKNRNTGGVLSRNRAAVAIIAAFTVLVEAGFFILGNHCGDGTEGVITALAATAIWSAIIPASVAACSESLWDRFIRGGCVADCGFISFCIIWLWLVAGGRAVFMVGIEGLLRYGFRGAGGMCFRGHSPNPWIPMPVSCCYGPVFYSGIIFTGLGECIFGFCRGV